jgi:uncharacterized protein (TIGR00251 family)
MLREVPGGVTLAVRAQPGAKKTAVAGIYGEGGAARLKISVQAPPVEGRANEALIVFLTDFFSLSRRDVVLISGELSRSKVFLLRGARLAEVRERIEPPCP